MMKLLALIPVAILLYACGDSFDHAGACKTETSADYKKRAIQIALRGQSTKATARTEKYKIEPLESIVVSADNLDKLNDAVLKQAKDRRFRAQYPRVRKIIRDVKTGGGTVKDIYIVNSSHKTLIGEWTWFFYNTCVSWLNKYGSYQVISATIQDRSNKPR